LFSIGCATIDDLNRVRGELNYHLQATDEKINALEKQYAPLREEIERFDKEIKNIEDGLSPIRTSHAELRAEMTDIKERLLQIRGLIDSVKEELRKELSSFDAKAGKRKETEKLLNEKIDDLTFKTNFIENFLGIGKKDGQEKQPVDDSSRTDSGQPAPKDEAAGISTSDKASLYTAAFALFKEGKYEKAREAFENFLKQYPSTEFSDNAQFWLGECYYFEKKYEEAIVEYDKVIKNFPGGNKLSYALLKQGLSFLKLGDKTSAKLLLQQVTKDYPNTSQARIARAKLLEIK
jgi:tol-pal system protein YbgF